MESESINKQIVVVAIESVVENRISNPQDVAVAVEVDHGNWVADQENIVVAVEGDRHPRVVDADCVLAPKYPKVDVAIGHSVTLVIVNYSHYNIY